MSRPRRATELPVFCFLMLGLMAIGAGSAHAESGAHWNVNGSAISGTLLPEVSAIGETVLQSRVLGGTFEILCAGTEFENTTLKTEGGSSGRIRFVLCSTRLNGKTSLPCEPHTGIEKGVILTNLLKGLIVLHEGAPVNRIEPAEGEVVVTAQTSAECAVGTKIPLIGKIFMKDSLNEGTVEKVTHNVEELRALTKLWILSKTAEHVASLEGSLGVFLIFSHNGLKFSGTPA